MNDLLENNALLIAIISVVVPIISVVIAHFANKTAKEANKKSDSANEIAKEANKIAERIVNLAEEKAQTPKINITYDSNKKTPAIKNIGEADAVRVKVKYEFPDRSDTSQYNQDLVKICAHEKADLKPLEEPGRNITNIKRVRKFTVFVDFYNEKGFVWYESKEFDV